MAKKHLICLEFKNGVSAKQYTLWIEPNGKKFDVVTQWGKISDTTPEQKTKNAKPLDKAEAELLYAKVISEKAKKGYAPVKGSLPDFIKGALFTEPKKVIKKSAKKEAKGSSGKPPGKSARKVARTPKAGSDNSVEFIVKYHVTICFKEHQESGEQSYMAESKEEAEEMIQNDWDNNDFDFFGNTELLFGPDNAAKKAGIIGGDISETSLDAHGASRAKSAKTKLGELAEFIVKYTVRAFFEDATVPGSKTYAATSPEEAEEMLLNNWRKGQITDFIDRKFLDGRRVESSDIDVLEVKRAK